MKGRRERETGERERRVLGFKRLPDLFLWPWPKMIFLVKLRQNLEKSTCPIPARTSK